LSGHSFSTASSRTWRVATGQRNCCCFKQKADFTNKNWDAVHPISSKMWAQDRSSKKVLKWEFNKVKPPVSDGSKERFAG
jgi:hypothetical protein